MLKKITYVAMSTLIAALLLVMLASFITDRSYAETIKKTVTYDGFTFEIYIDDGNVGSVYISKYSGTATTVKLPTHIMYNNQEIPIQMISVEAFKDNKTVQKVIIPNGYEYIGQEAFMGCDNLQEVIIGSLPGQADFAGLGDNAFADCPKLKTLVIGWKPTEATSTSIRDIGIGKGSTNVTVYVTTGSEVENSLRDKSGTNVTFVSIASDTGKAKSAEANYKLVLPKSSTTVKPATNVKPGQKAEAVKKYLIKYSSESDPKGSSFNLLQAKTAKVTKSYIKISYKKPSGTKKFMIFASKCGSKNKLKYLKTVTAKSFTQKKLKKGTYYKYLVVAVNSKGNVVSTSKVIHAATKGGKVGNDKKVTTKAKKNKVTLKKGKSFSLKAKAVPASKKLKVKRHRKIKYESSKTSIATVSSKGVIKAKKKGTCYVYAYAQNGFAAKVKVTVK